MDYIAEIQKTSDENYFLKKIYVSISMTEIKCEK